jgi:hypothetical protein
MSPARRGYPWFFLCSEDSERRHFIERSIGVDDMTSEQKTRYETMKQMAKDELDHLDRALSEEVTRAKQRIEELQKSKRAVKQIYDNACTLLGVTSIIEMKDYGLGDMEKHA